MRAPAEPGAAARHVAVCTAAAYSHIGPLPGTVAEPVRRGVHVSYATTEQFAPLVKSVGATPVPVRSSLPADPADWPTDIRRLPLLYLDDARAALPQLTADFARNRPDLVLTEDPAGAGSVLAARWGIPSMQVWTYLAAPHHWSLTPPGRPRRTPWRPNSCPGWRSSSRRRAYGAQRGTTWPRRCRADWSSSPAPSSRTAAPSARSTPSWARPRPPNRRTGPRPTRTPPSPWSPWVRSTTPTRSSSRRSPRRSPIFPGTS